MQSEDNRRWSVEDSEDVLKSIYCLYHTEVLGYTPTWIPVGASKDWFVEQLKAFDWYTNFGTYREEVKKEFKPLPRVKRTKPKNKSPFSDET